MNSRQLKYLESRIDAIIRGKIALLEVSKLEKEELKEIKKWEKLRNRVCKKINAIREKRMAKSNAAVAALKAAKNKIMDELALGDEAKALKMLKEFENAT